MTTATITPRALDRAKARVKRREHYCADPFSRHVERRARSTVVHQVVRFVAPLTEDVKLVALCAACHNKVQAMDRAGESTAELFTATGTE